MPAIIYNEHHIRSLLMRDDLDFNKFNKIELIDFLNVAAKDLKKLKTPQERQIELIEYALKHNVDYVYVLEDLLKLVKGQDIKIDLESYLD